MISGEGEEKGKVVKKIITGVRATGKSVHLLQAMAMAFTKKWVVFTVPERMLRPCYLHPDLLFA
jgi:small subunit ribosomal protein S29